MISCDVRAMSTHHCCGLWATYRATPTYTMYGNRNVRALAQDHCEPHPLTISYKNLRDALPATSSQVLLTLQDSLLTPNWELHPSSSPLPRSYTKRNPLPPKEASSVDSLRIRFPSSSTQTQIMIQQQKTSSLFLLFVVASLQVSLFVYSNT